MLPKEPKDTYTVILVYHMGPVPSFGYTHVTACGACDARDRVERSGKGRVAAVILGLHTDLLSSYDTEHAHLGFDSEAR